MANSSYVQTSFLGGEWGSFSQGRFEEPLYKIAMRVCYNGLPLEEGAWVRRSGTRYIGMPPAGVAGRVLPFDPNTDSPFLLEFSDNTLRFIQGLNYVCTTDVFGVDNISADNPSIVTVAPTNTWPSGTYVVFDQSGDPNMDCTALRNRQFIITRQIDLQQQYDSGTTYAVNDIVVSLGVGGFISQLDGNTGNDPVTDDGTHWIPYHGLDGQFVLADPVTNAPVQVADYNPRDALTVQRILSLASPYTGGAWASVRVIQTIQGLASSPITDQCVLVGGGQPVQVVTPTFPLAAHFTQFTLNAAAFEDGPYLDPIIGSIIVPTLLGNGTLQLDFSFLPWSDVNVYGRGDIAESGSVAFQSQLDGNVGIEPDIDNSGAWLPYNGTPFGFYGAAGADIGRHIRLFNEPPIWDPLAAYVAGDDVAYETQDGRINYGYYHCLQGNVGVPPDTNLTSWQISSTNYRWTWGTVLKVNSPTQVVIQLRGQPLLAVEQVRIWRLGLYGGTANYQPVCGTWFEGRLWLMGALANRLDGSQPDDPFNFAPTETDGAVTDANAISYSLNSGNSEPIIWCKPHAQGIICGTKSREWLVQANTAQDPLTPTNIDAHPVSKYGSAAVEPVETELGIIFAHRDKRRVLEMFADVFTGKFAAPHLSERAKHLTGSGTGVEEMVRQDEKAPIIWARIGNNPGSLVGTTYRRISSFSTEKPAFNAWHRHELGSGRQVTSICQDLDPTSTLQTLAMVTNSNPVSPPDTNGQYHIERMQDLFDQNQGMLNAWFVDDAVTPSMVDVTTGVICYGLRHLEGKTVTAWLGGLDCGDHVVANGAITVPYASDPAGRFTAAYMASVTSPQQLYGNVGAVFDSIVSETHTVSPGAGTICDLVQGLGGNPWNPPPVANWGDNTLYVQRSGFFSDSFIYKIDMNTGLLIKKVSDADAGTGGLFGLPMCVGGDGNLYYNTSVSNACAIVKLDTTTMTVFGTGNPAWSSGTTYGPGAKVDVNFTGFVSLQAGNIGHTPGANSPWWLPIPDKYGDGDLFSSGPDIGRCPSPKAMIGAQFAGDNYIIACGNNSLYAINTDQMAWTSFALDTSRAWGGLASTVMSLVKGPNRAASSIIYGLGFPDSFITDMTTSLPVYTITLKSGASGVAVAVGAWSSGTTYAKGAEVTYHNLNYTSTVNGNLNHTPGSGSQWLLVTNSGISASVTGLIAPHMVDATWTHFLQTGIGSLVYDPTDGNLIMALATNDAVTNQKYLVKINPNTMQFVWKTPYTGNLSMPGPSSRIESGVFSTISGTVISVINTRTGVITHTAAPGVTQNSFGGTYNIVDSQSGTIVASMEFATTTGSPAPVGATASSFGNRIAAFSYGGYAGSYITTTQSRFFVPAVVGFNYVSQGQIMETIRPEDAGTRAGPAFGKIRRDAQFATKVTACGQLIQFGCIPKGNYSRFMNYPRFGQIGTPFPTDPSLLFDGTFWTTIEGEYSLDNSLAWQVVRPYPATITAIGGFTETQDR